MPKIRLVPQNREFYSLFERAAANLVSAAQLLLELLEHYPDRKHLVAEIRTASTRATVSHTRSFSSCTRRL